MERIRKTTTDSIQATEAKIELIDKDFKEEKNFVHHRFKLYTETKEIKEWVNDLTTMMEKKL